MEKCLLHNWIVYNATNMVTIFPFDSRYNFLVKELKALQEVQMNT